MSNRPTLCVHSGPFRRLVERFGISHNEIGRRYSDRFTPGHDSTATVNRLLNSELIPVESADRLAMVLDMHPLNIWDQQEWDEPIPISGGLKNYERKRRAS